MCPMALGTREMWQYLGLVTLHENLKFPEILQLMHERNRGFP